MDSSWLVAHLALIIMELKFEHCCHNCSRVRFDRMIDVLHSGSLKIQKTNAVLNGTRCITSILIQLWINFAAHWTLNMGSICESAMPHTQYLQEEREEIKIIFWKCMNLTEKLMPKIKLCILHSIHSTIAEKNGSQHLN